MLNQKCLKEIYNKKTLKNTLKKKQENSKCVHTYMYNLKNPCSVLPMTAL